ncbi:MAG TPA: hypothetical protein VFK19_03565 [Sphingomicrobium sp.]|nr:hypothetical protein [Sphingomicrobium sp.]
MDLNYLLHRQQVERSRAEDASSEAAREAHRELAHQYEEQIEAVTGNMFSIAAEEEPAPGDPINQAGRR